MGATMSEGPARSDLDAHDYVTGLPVGAVIRELVALVGATTVAVIGGVKETRAVQQWMEGRAPQREHALRFALQLAVMLAACSEAELMRAWFHAANPRLDDRIPMLMLRDMHLEDVRGPLLNAARAFAGRQGRSSGTG